LDGGSATSTTNRPSGVSLRNTAVTPSSKTSLRYQADIIIPTITSSTYNNIKHHSSGNIEIAESITPCTTTEAKDSRILIFSRTSSRTTPTSPHGDFKKSDICWNDIGLGITGEIYYKRCLYNRGT
jgi:hypothetical protein